MTDIDGTTGPDDLGREMLISLDPVPELGDFSSTYLRFQQDPAGLVAEMRTDDGFRVAMARADVRHHLLRWFQEDEAGWQDDLERSGPLGDASVGTSWTFSGIHVEESTPDDRVVGGVLASGEEVEVVGFNGVTPTGNRITVRGFTVMSAVEGKPDLAVHRHVDWAGLFGQLGLTLNWRIPIDDPDPES